MRLVCFAALAVTMFALIQAGSAPAEAGSGACIMIWAPICAEKDGVSKTYSSRSCAEADDARVLSEGECGKRRAGLGCPQYIKPVCASIGGRRLTYINRVCAASAGARVVALHACR